MQIPAVPRPNGFMLTTGVTFAAFASGFGVCLFDLSTVDACVNVANQWVDVFHRTGDHIIRWAMAILDRVF
jgi:hypothetical protein